jgi:diadenosine tetraphosphatase ApaH/serine/threonine PP2A family protein phosphatase
VDVFDHLNIAALIDGRVLCVHGGLSPEIRTLDQVNVINRLQEIPHEGAFCDMMWSDPEEIPDAWRISPRGAGYLFGAKVTDEFNHVNGLELICRAHQLVMEGYKYQFPNENICTVWSAPNYCYRRGRLWSRGAEQPGALLLVKERADSRFVFGKRFCPKSLQQPRLPSIERNNGQWAARHRHGRLIVVN